MRPVKTFPLLLTALVAALTSSVYAAPQKDSAFEAAIIYNLARFSQWPANRFATDSSPVTLCVAPGDPIASSLAELEGKPVGSRPLHVRKQAAFGKECHLAFVSAEDATPANLEALSRRGILAIGDRDGFAASGAIGLVTIGRQLRFEVNVRAAREAGVQFSSQMLRLATSVR
jgi:hypothetical protein